MIRIHIPSIKIRSTQWEFVQSQVCISQSRNLKYMYLSRDCITEAYSLEIAQQRHTVLRLYNRGIRSWDCGLTSNWVSYVFSYMHMKIVWRHSTSEGGTHTSMRLLSLNSSTFRTRVLATPDAGHTCSLHPLDLWSTPSQQWLWILDSLRSLDCRLLITLMRSPVKM